MTDGDVARLDTSEVLHAAVVGVMRRVASLRREGRPRYEQDAVDRWTAEIEGACAELCVSKLTGTHWNALVRNTAGLPDCGPYHVRWTPRDNGSLILHDDDPDATFVLVTGRAPTFVIRGAIASSAGREPRYWRSDVPMPAYFVPSSALAPFPARQQVAA